MKEGAFTFVLHSHLPYVRHAGRWPHGEEWIHEAAIGTYLPLLNGLTDLAEARVPYHLTIGLTPVLTEQLADPLVLEHFQEYAENLVRLAQADVERFEGAGEQHLAYLARYYVDLYQGLLQSFRERFGGSIVGAFRGLQERGYIEIATSAATHGYLPLLSRDSSIHGQVAIGTSSYRRHFGRSPRSIWLPECAYRPPYYTSTGPDRVLKPGIETFLAEVGLNLFFVETHTIEGGEPVGKARGDAIGPYGNVPRRYLVPVTAYSQPTEKSTYRAYWVQTPQVAALGRNNRTGLQVWSAEHGYPGDYSYREFHKKDGLSGMRYWKVTGARIDLGEKELYDPYWALKKAGEHAAHFAELVEGLLSEYRARTGEYGIIAAAYDTELFGHWWAEGVDWIVEVLRHLSGSEVVDLATAGGYLADDPPDDVLALPESSWGQAGNHFTWLNVDTEWMWPVIHEAERRMERLVAQHPEATGLMAEVLNQAARELLLLESSDWPFLVTTGQAREYAIERFEEHVDRFSRLAGIAESGQAGDEARALVDRLFELDNIFPALDYRVFREREGEVHPPAWERAP